MDKEVVVEVDKMEEVEDGRRGDIRCGRRKERGKYKEEKKKNRKDPEGQKRTKRRKRRKRVMMGFGGSPWRKRSAGRSRGEGPPIRTMASRR